jgi:hypothetical protein
VACFGKVLWKPRFTLSSAVGNAGVVAVSLFVGASHWRRLAPLLSSSCEVIEQPERSMPQGGAPVSKEEGGTYCLMFVVDSELIVMEGT